MPNLRLSPDAYTSALIVSNKTLHHVRKQPAIDPRAIVESHETCRLIITAMTPTETLIATCRWHQLPDSVPAEVLGITPQRIGQIMHQFKRRLIAQYPYLRPTIEGRRYSSQP